MGVGKIRIALTVLYMVGDLALHSKNIDDYEVFFYSWFFVVPVTIVGGWLADLVADRVLMLGETNALTYKMAVCVFELSIVFLSPDIVRVGGEALSNVGVSVIGFSRGVGDYLVVAALLAVFLMIFYRVLSLYLFGRKGKLDGLG